LGDFYLQRLIIDNGARRGRKHFFTTPFRDEVLAKRRPWYLLAGVLFLLSAIAHVAVAFLAGLFVLVVGLIPEIWYRSAFLHLTFHLQSSQQALFFGENMTLSLRVENKKLLPLPWLEVENEVPSFATLLTGETQAAHKPNRSLLINALSLWSFQRVTRHYQFHCTRRGVYTFGPMTIRCSDPFGWLTREELIPVNETVCVYPLLAPLSAFDLPARHLFGEYTTPQRLLEDPLRFAGIRDYMIGDDPRRIHWKTTARTGALRCKVYEPSSQYRLLIVLDVNTFAASWMGIDPELHELTISTAASIAVWALDEGYIVGLLTNSLLAAQMDTQESNDSPMQTATTTYTSVPRIRVPFASDHEQRERLLLAFARMLPYMGEPMAALLEAESDLFPRETTVVMVSATTALTAATIECLLDLQSRRVNVQLVLAGDEKSKEELDTEDLPVSYIGGREVWHELVATCDGTGQSTSALQLD